MSGEHTFDYGDPMTDPRTLELLLEQHRRSIAMLPAGTPLSREAALDLVRQCQEVLTAARHPSAGVVAPSPPPHRRPRRS